MSANICCPCEKLVRPSLTDIRKRYVNVDIPCIHCISQFISCQVGMSRLSRDTGQTHQYWRKMSRNILRALMFGCHGDRDAAAHREFADYATPVRIERSHQVVEHDVGYVFVENALVAKRPDIQLERLTLHDPLVRNIFHDQMSEIRLAGHRAYRREFVGFKAYRVTSV